MARTRARAGGLRDKADAEVVEEALTVYLGMKALDDAQTESALNEDEANRLASEALDAMRREQDASG